MTRFDQAQPTSSERGWRSASGHPQFSLLSLSLAIAILCLVAAYFGASRREHDALQRAAALEERLAHKSKEISRLRAELGALTVRDPTKLHLLPLPTRDEHHWKWRIYLPALPAGKAWILRTTVGQVRDAGYNSPGPCVSRMAELSAGEFTLDAYVHRDQGRPRFVVRWPTGKTPFEMRQEEYEQLVGLPRSLFAAGSAAEMEMRDPAAGPMELFRLRALEEVSRTPISRLWRPPDHPSFGVLIWLEEAPPLSLLHDVEPP